MSESKTNYEHNTNSSDRQQKTNMRIDNAKSHYEILGVDKNATLEEINKAYRTLASQYHPDITKDKSDENTRRLKKINEAKEVLSDIKKRALYDSESQQRSRVQENTAGDQGSKQSQNNSNGNDQQSRRNNPHQETARSAKTNAPDVPDAGRVSPNGARMSGAAGVGMAVHGLNNSIKEGDAEGIAIAGADLAVSTGDMALDSIDDVGKQAAKQATQIAIAGADLAVSTGDMALDSIDDAGKQAAKQATQQAGKQAGQAATREALKRIATRANVVITIADGAYQVYKEDGNFINEDGSIGHKGQRAVAATITSGAAAAGGYAAAAATTSALAAAGVTGAAATVATVAAPIVAGAAVAYGAVVVTDTAIETARIYEKEAERFNAHLESLKHFKGSKQRVASELTDELKKAGLMQKGKDGKYYLEDGTELALDKKGVILNISDIDFSNGKNFAALEKAYDRRIAETNRTMEENSSIAPRWIRWGESVDNYNNAESDIKILESAKKEMAELKKRTEKIDGLRQKIRDEVEAASAEAAQEAKRAPVEQTQTVPEPSKESVAQQPTPSPPSSPTPPTTEQSEIQPQQPPAQGVNGAAPSIQGALLGMALGAGARAMGAWLSSEGNSQSAPIASQGDQLAKELVDAIRSGDTQKINDTREAAFAHFAGVDGKMSKEESQKFKDAYAEAFEPGINERAKTKSTVADRKLRIIQQAITSWNAAEAQTKHDLVRMQGDTDKSVEFALQNRGLMDTDHDGRLDKDVRQALKDNPKLIAQVDEALKGVRNQISTTQPASLAQNMSPSAGGMGQVATTRIVKA